MPLNTARKERAVLSLTPTQNWGAAVWASTGFSVSQAVQGRDCGGTTAPHSTRLEEPGAASRLCFLLPQQGFYFSKGRPWAAQFSLAGVVVYVPQAFLYQPQWPLPTLHVNNNLSLISDTKSVYSHCQVVPGGGGEVDRVAPDGGETTHYLHTEASLEET